MMPLLVASRAALALSRTAPLLTAEQGPVQETGKGMPALLPPIDAQPLDTENLVDRRQGMVDDHVVPAVTLPSTAHQPPAAVLEEPSLPARLDQAIVPLPPIEPRKKASVGSKGNEAEPQFIELPPIGTRTK
jgi:hypothetical protein